MQDKAKEAPAVPEGTTSELVSPNFTKAESSIIMALIGNGWRTAAIGSRSGFELLAAVEDKMKMAGAVQNSLPPGV